MTRLWVVIGLIVILSGGIWASSRHPWAIPAQTNPPTERVIPLHKGRVIQQTITVTTSSIQQASFFVRANSGTPDTAPIILHIRPVGSTTDLRTVATTWGQAYSHDVIRLPFVRLPTKP